MKKKNAIIIVVIAVIAFIATIAYAVTPEKNVKYYTQYQKKTFTESLVNISGAKIKNKYLELTLNEEDLNKLISSIENVNEYRVVLNEKDADVYVPVKFMKVINTNVKVSFDVKAEDGGLNFTIKESKLGKIKINNQHIMKYVKNGAYDKFNVEKRDSSIYVTNKLMIFNEATVKNNELIVKCTLDLKEIVNELTNKFRL